MLVLDMCKETLPELKIEKSIKVFSKLANSLNLEPSQFNLLMAMFVFCSGKPQAFKFTLDSKTQLYTNSYLGRVFSLPQQYFQTLQVLIEGQIFKKELIQKLERLIFIGQQHQIPGMDPRLVKGIFVLATGETELLDSLSDLLNINPDILESCVLLSNFAKPSINREIALHSLSQSSSFQSMLQRIGIPSNIIILLLKYSFLELNKNEIKEMLLLLQIERNLVDLETLTAILSVIKATRLKKLIRPEQSSLLEMQRIQNKQHLRSGIMHLSKYYHGKNERIYCLAISLYFGDFKVLRDYRELISPLLPNQCLVHVAMGLVGILRSPISHRASSIKLIQNEPITFEGAISILQSLLGINPIIFKMASFEEATFKQIEIQHNFSKNVMVQIIIALSNLPLSLLQFLLEQEFKIRFSHRMVPSSDYSSINRSFDEDISLSKIYIRDQQDQSSELERQYTERCNVFGLPHIFKNYEELFRLENSQRCFNLSTTKRRKILGKKKNWKALGQVNETLMLSLLQLFNELSKKESKHITLGQLIMAVLLLGVRRSVESKDYTEGRNFASIMADLNLVLLQLQFEMLLQNKIPEFSALNKIDMLTVLGLALKIPVAREMEKVLLPSLFRPDIYKKVQLHLNHPLLGAQELFADINQIGPSLFQQRKIKEVALFQQREYQILECFNQFNPVINYYAFAEERDRVLKNEGNISKNENIRLAILECLLLQSTFLNFLLKLTDYQTVMSADFQSEIMERCIVASPESERAFRALIVLSQVEQMMEDIKDTEERSLLPDIKSELHMLLQNIPIDLILTEALLFIAHGSRENYHLSSLGSRLSIQNGLLRTFFASSISNELKRNIYKLQKFLEPLLISLRSREELALILFEVFYGLVDGWEGLGLKFIRNKAQNPKVLQEFLNCFDWHMIRKQMRNNAQIYHSLEYLKNPHFIRSFSAILELMSPKRIQNQYFSSCISFIYNLYSQRPDFSNSWTLIGEIFKISSESDLQLLEAILVLLFSSKVKNQKRAAGYFEKSLLKVVNSESKQVRLYSGAISVLLFQLEEPLPGNFYNYKSILANLKKKFELRAMAGDSKDQKVQLQNEFQFCINKISNVISSGKEAQQAASKYLANYEADELEVWFQSPNNTDHQLNPQAELIGMIIQGKFAELLLKLPQNEQLEGVSEFLVDQQEQKRLREKARGFACSLYEVLAMDYSKFIHFVDTMHQFCVVTNFTDNLFLKKDKIFITTGWILLAIRFQCLGHRNILKEIQILQREIIAQTEWAHEEEDPSEIYEILINTYFGRDNEQRKLTREDRLQNMVKLYFKIFFVGFENYREVIGTLITILLKITEGSEKLGGKLQNCLDEFSLLFGANPKLVGDLVDLMNWDFDVLARILDPVVAIHPEVLKHQAYSLKMEAEEAAIRERNEELKKQFQKKGVSDSFFKDLLKKINEGSASYRDLFQLTDQSGNGNGIISVSEFQRLLARLGIQISQERAIEIFTSAKRRVTGQFQVEQYPAQEQELNEEEFQKAVKYVYSKTEDAALQQMGLSTENLVIIFSTLLVILLLLFVFIFLGIAAFSVGGTFGSIINSIFPILAGVGVSRKKDETETVDQEKAEQAYQEALQIIQSQK